MLEELVTARIAEFRVPADRLDQIREEFSSRIVEVQHQGMLAVETLRRRHGDRVTLPDWEGYAREVMTQGIARIFVELGLDDDEGLAGVPVGSSPKPRPSLGTAQIPLGGAREVLVPVVSHQEYLGDRDGLAQHALRLAWRYTKRVVGSWSSDSSQLEDFAATAAAAGVLGCERNWNPVRGSLETYLSCIVLRSVKRQYRDACERRRREHAVREWAAAELAQTVQVTVSPRDYDPRLDDDPLALERSEAPYADVLKLLIRQLGELQQAEIRRFLTEDTTGTEAQKGRRKRAVAAMRDWAESVPRVA